MSLVIARNSGARHNDVRLIHERLPGPANFHAVRACVSTLVAHWMKSQVAFRFFSGRAELIGKPQFQIEVVRLPDGPLGQRA